MKILFSLWVPTREEEIKEASWWRALVRPVASSNVLKKYSFVTVVTLLVVLTISVLQLKSNYQQYSTTPESSSRKSMIYITEYTNGMMELLGSTVLQKPAAEAQQEAQQEHQENKPLCTAEQVASGRWISHILTKFPYNSSYRQETCGDYERRDNFNGTHLQSYRWILDDQDTCDFPMTVWNRTKACQLIKNQTILMIGDSLSNEHYASLGHMTGSKSGDEHRSWKTCDDTAQVVFRRSDYLATKYVTFEFTRVPDYALLNFGAHYVDDEKFLMIIHQTIQQVQVWQRRCKELNKTSSCQLIWRTTVPGHPRCEQGHHSKSPNNNLTAMEELVATGGGPARFHWEEFKHQNELAIAAIQESGVDFVVLDAYSINILRPDGHVLGPGGDCLHSCLGSKIDVYTQALFHLIQLQKSATQPSVSS